MPNIRTFLNKILNLFHKFFAPSIFHKKTIDPRGIKYVGHLTRFSSIMLDLILYTLVLYFISALVSMFFSVPLSLESMERYKLGLKIEDSEQAYINKYIIIVLLSQIVQFMIIMCISVFMWHRYGVTPAKFITGTIILDEKTLQLPSLKQSIKRFFALILSILPVFLGIIWVIFDKKGQAWHDKIAGTIVVVKSSLKEVK